MDEHNFLKINILRRASPEGKRVFLLGRPAMAPGPPQQYGVNNQ